MRDKKGFTLIELLIVVVIIGILAAIAIPKFSATRERAFVSAMKSDLKNLASQQEIWYADAYTYTTDISAAGLEWSGSDGTLAPTLQANSTGWSATIGHSGTAVTCAVFYGDAAAVAPATVPGVVTCDPLP